MNTKLKFRRVRYSDLTGIALDWCVAIAKGISPRDMMLPTKKDSQKWKRIYRLSRDGDGKLTGSHQTGPELMFSSQWGSGGPLIDKAKISLDHRESECQARWWDPKTQNFLTTHGPTALVAAMRCYVLINSGEFVDVPDVLFGD